MSFRCFQTVFYIVKANDIARRLNRTPLPKSVETDTHDFRVILWSLFIILQVDTVWLIISESLWKSDPDYSEAEMFVRLGKLVNDPSERSIKLIQDFANSINNNEIQLRYLMHVVKHHCKAIPNFLQRNNKQFLIINN